MSLSIGKNQGSITVTLIVLSISCKKAKNDRLESSWRNVLQPTFINSWLKVAGMNKMSHASAEG
ncbi:Uncharacterized protein EbC_pEb17200610 (plasmid) [Erwinia billingiae Eb661]|uniref:Lipoprotein n=1 Tax=Erwinia billingiae (strain Eb661) TaxID=634500 RepID=D8MJR6_ERWBE|nr:Uncharacterized protein EbC_pEb17200610 [Erwinia billingiae Eb661]